MLGRRFLPTVALSLAALGAGCHDFAEVRFGVQPDAGAPDVAADIAVDIAVDVPGNSDAAADQVDAGCPADQLLVGSTCQPQPRSCVDLAATCPECAMCNGQSCCSYTLVEGSADFSKGYDGTNGIQGSMPIPGWAKLGDARAVVRSFYLDQFEVTVGRFRKFLDSYALPQGYLGDRPGDVAGTSGWKRVWENANLTGKFWAATKEDLVKRLPTCVLDSGEKGGAQIAGWLASPSADTDRRPMTCVTWFEAMMFCIWDGGRLPFETEWQYAAVGGDMYLPFPWTGASATDDVKASANVEAAGFTLKAVGSYPKATRWLQYDLAGNAYEMVRDWVNTSAGAPSDSLGHEFQSGFAPAIKGGSIAFPPLNARSVHRFSLGDASLGILTYPDLGWRCARDPK